VSGREAATILDAAAMTNYKSVCAGIYSCGYSHAVYVVYVCAHTYVCVFTYTLVSGISGL